MMSPSSSARMMQPARHSDAMVSSFRSQPYSLPARVSRSMPCAYATSLDAKSARRTSSTTRGRLHQRRWLQSGRRAVRAVPARAAHARRRRGTCEHGLCDSGDGGTEVQASLSGPQAGTLLTRCVNNNVDQGLAGLCVDLCEHLSGDFNQVGAQVGLVPGLEISACCAGSMPATERRMS